MPTREQEEGEIAGDEQLSPAAMEEGWFVGREEFVLLCCENKVSEADLKQCEGCPSLSRCVFHPSW